MYLETGTGKTLIAACLVKQSATRFPKQNVAVLVPTALLVSQQAKEIRRVYSEPVGEYTGDRGVDNFDTARWQREFRYTSLERLRH